MTECCYFCGEIECIETHHIVPRRFDGSDKDENLVDVCPTCHSKLESLYDKRFYETLGISDETGERKHHFDCGMTECSNRAEVRCGPDGYEPVWHCLNCATDLYISWDGYGTVYEDVTGRMKVRTNWIDAYINRPLKVIRRD